MTRERPILFSGPMVRALLAGTKTQTRRVVTSRHVDFIGGRDDDHDDPDLWGFWADADGAWAVLGQGHNGLGGDDRLSLPCPHGAPGDRLWVRETWAAHWMYDDVPAREAKSRHPNDNYWFASDPEGTLGTHGCPAEGRRGRWRPSIHVPRWASRITLEITEVRVQRLQDISEEDALAEGVTMFEGGDDDPVFAEPIAAYQHLWDSINGDRAPWTSNPWVWALTFKRVTP